MIIQSRKVWMDECFKASQIEMNGGRITGVWEYGTQVPDVDFEDHMILPGFIDIHCHGYGGVSANAPTAEDLKRWMEHMPFEGVTSFLVTTSTQSHERNVNALSTIAGMCGVTGCGAEILGINMEGNFIAHEYKGGQDPYAIVRPDAKLLEEYQKHAGGKIKTVTCAVEKDTGFVFCDAAKAMGIPVSAGHTGAKYDEILEAQKHGLCGITHTGNAMRGIHHREPGTFGAALLMDELYAEVIGDGIHVHFGIVKMIGRMKGKDKLILVTDSSVYKEYTGIEPIEGKAGVIKRGGAFVYEDGTLTGSALKVNEGVYNLIYKAGLPFETAINAATTNPARYIGEEHRKGSIKEGMDADLVVCDEKFHVAASFVVGKAMF